MALTNKQLRTIDFDLERLFNPKSILAPKSIKDFSVSNPLLRMLQLTENRTLLLSDTGLTHFRSIVATIDRGNVFDGLASYSDIWTTCRRILEDLLSRKVMPDSGAELVELVRNELGPTISNHTFAVPLFGVAMDGTDAFPVGSMKIVPSPIPHFDSLRVKHEQAGVPAILDATKPTLWLLGSANGTRRVAVDRFREQAELTAGMLAVSAASMYEGGASAFHIGVVMSSERSRSRAVWFSWSERDLELATTYDLSGPQMFKIDDAIAERFPVSSVFPRAFQIFEAKDRTEVEEGIVKAVYWFSDAHRDPAVVMKLIKYWSCIETFFSADHKEITKSVSTGLAAVLVFGAYNFVPSAEYIAFKRRIAKLYELRSRAIHGGKYRHVSDRDVNDLSQWVAWMLINMISFVERGYSKIAQIKDSAARLDKKAVVGRSARPSRA